MGIYIPNVKMPDECKDCVCYCEEECMGSYCKVTGEDLDFIEGRDDECPLIEVKQPHGRLIDADAYEYHGDLKDEPTVIEAEEAEDE